MADVLWPFYPWMHLAGRILFALIFVMSGMNHLVDHKGMTAYAEFKKVPVPGAAVLVSGVMIIAGGLMIALGWHRFIAAGLLLIFLLLAAFLVHAFWRETDPQARATEMAHFLKNLSMAGAALFMAFYAGYSWPMSLGG